jgi:hypothetical protein
MPDPLSVYLKQNLSNTFIFKTMLMKVYKRLFPALVHVLLWGVLIVFPKFFMPASFNVSIKNELLLWTPIVVFFYINYFLLIPFFLTRKKFSLYAISIMVILGITLAIGGFSRPPLPPADQLKNAPPAPPEIHRYKTGLFYPFMGLRNLTSCFLFLAIGTSIRVTEQWYSDDKKRKETENQKLIAELSFLKSQINPHFFFNKLNSIFSLAIQKSEKTPEALIKLSELMRFLIYDSEKEFVPLKRELDYIKNYVELQKLRLMSNVTVNYHIEGNYHDKELEPLLLLPFIENAFKHGIDSIKKCHIGILVKISDSFLTLVVENPVVRNVKTPNINAGGIGLANSKKRLELLYGPNYQLNIDRNNDFYRIELQLNFKQ